MESIALTGASVDKERGLISTIVREMGGSTSLIHTLKPGDPVIFMGPTGAPTPILCNKNVILIGGGLGNAVLLSIGSALRANGCRVLYIAGYTSETDRFKKSDIEDAADQVIWCCDEPHAFQDHRPQDMTFHGNPIDAVRHILGTHSRSPIFDVHDTDHLMVIGSDRLMAATAQALRTDLASVCIKPKFTVLARLNSPMQCMLKAVCAMCLQSIKDPLTGKEKVIYACAQQDQPLDHICFDTLYQRLRQNILAESVCSY
jgi:NAD(P)H-flavin reductase